MITRLALLLSMCLLATGETFAQGPIPNVNDGSALQRECSTALRAVDEDPSPNRPRRLVTRPRRGGHHRARRARTVPSNPVERGSDMGQCLGLVSGVWHTHMMMVDEFDSGSAFCPTASISAGEMARIVNRYLQTYPAQLDQWDTVLILRAFMTVYPCS